MLTTLLTFAVIAVCAAAETTEKRTFGLQAEELRSAAVFKNNHSEVLHF